MMKNFMLKVLLVLIASLTIFGFIGYNISETYQVILKLNTTVSQNTRNIEQSLSVQQLNDLKLGYAILALSKELKGQSENLMMLTCTLPNMINQKIMEDKVSKLLLVKKLQQVNVFIRNRSIDALGSGVTLKYKDKFYVLTAAHLVENETDKLEMWEEDKKVSDLIILKRTDKDRDLMLLKVADETLEPLNYTELADIEPPTAEEFYVVGNPAGVEDVVSSGRVTRYDGNYMIGRAGCFFGNSGGGVYNSKGDLVGIVSATGAISSGTAIPSFQLDLYVRLNIIKEFLQDIGN